MDGDLRVGRAGEALWGKESFACEFLAMAGEYIIVALLLTFAKLLNTLL